MKNEILQEVWRNRDEFAREHDYNIDAIIAALQKMEKQSVTQTIDRRDKTSTESSHPKQENTGVA